MAGHRRRGKSKKKKTGNMFLKKFSVLMFFYVLFSIRYSLLKKE